MDHREANTKTSAFGVGRREGHDASAFYRRFAPPELSDDDVVNRPDALIDELGHGRTYVGAIDELRNLPDNSVALVVTSPPYFVGKEYELAVTGGADGERQVPATYVEFLDMLRGVFAECRRVLEPGGRIAVNVANLGRKPYRSLSADVISILQDDLGLLLRGEVIWEKSSASSGSCAWGSFAKASNPVLRDMTERVLIASKGRFARALTVKQRKARNLPHESTVTNDEFVEVTRDVWRIDAESATRIGHPAPFPIDLPRRLIDLYTYRGDLVVDPFVGSGTTLVAAARAGRIGVGYDTDADYAALAEQRLGEEMARITPPIDAADGPATTTAADFDQRREQSLSLAIAEGKKADVIVARHLSDAGFDVSTKGRHPSGVVEFAATASNAAGTRWWVEIGGPFTTAKPGLQRAEVAWRLLGRLHVTRGERVLVITPSLPRPRSPADKALRAVGPDAIFDVIELYDKAGMERLRHYAAADGEGEGEGEGEGNGPAAPIAGFWTEAELSR